ncbi:MAG: Translation elongation factor LepA, partial [uncultured Propionibacteriaceae bacterium]
RRDDGRQAQGAHPAPAVRGADPGRHRCPGDRPRDHPRHPQGCARQVLRGRHHPQAQAVREAEGRQEADEDGRPGGGAAGGLRGRPVDRRADQGGAEV